MFARPLCDGEPFGDQLHPVLHTASGAGDLGEEGGAKRAIAVRSTVPPAAFGLFDGIPAFAQAPLHHHADAAEEPTGDAEQLETTSCRDIVEPIGGRKDDRPSPVSVPRKQR